MERGLAQRDNDGITVMLLWQTQSDRLIVSVCDWRNGVDFDLAADPHDAMDVFEHPYAAGRGVEPEPVAAAL